MPNQNESNHSTDHAAKLRAAAEYLGGTYDGLDAELLAAADELDRLRTERQSKPTAEDDEFVARVTYLNDMARRCAEETVYRADLCGEDRNTVLRGVISRLKDAIHG